MTSRLRLTGVLQTLETSGTVREACGFASSTNTLPSSMAYCMFMRPQNHTRREQRKCLHFHCRAVWVSENVEGFGNLSRVILDGCQVFLRDGHRRDNASGVTGVDTGKFHVFHHGRDVNVLAVGEGVGFAYGDRSAFAPLSPTRLVKTSRFWLTAKRCGGSGR